MNRHKHRQKYRRATVAGAALALQFAAQGSPAQEAAGATAAVDGSQLDEIVVTARKRTESFRDVPIAVDVFTEQAIENAGIEKPADFIALVPNMTLVETQNAGNAFVVMRGISQARNSEPSVAVLVDGVLETNPAEFNQELFDLQQIEVLKGPQGALYGRNAIGGAIIMRTKEMPSAFEGTARLGVGNGTSERAQIAVGGPIDDKKSLRYRASLNFYNTEGFLQNVYLNQKADPARDYSGRWRMVWEASDSFSLDWRFSADRLETRGLYFVIPRSNEANPFSDFSTPPDANNTSTPITLDDPGADNRNILNTSLKMDLNVGSGKITSITALDSTRETLTGAAFDFRPDAQSFFATQNYGAFKPLGYDMNQSQYLSVNSASQELRFTSNKTDSFSWIAGAYFVHTNRFISTGNNLDTGAGVFPVYETPRFGGTNPSVTYLADSQNNNAWAVFGDATYEVTSQVEADVAARFDQDARKNTTDTPTAFLPDPSATTGEVRKHTWSKLQPKVTLRYKPQDNVTLYGGWSRGFRSGGFNQTGVGSVARANSVAGVNDLFEGEVADTFEVGAKGQFLDRRLNAGLSVYDTRSQNGYFFVFLAANSTQNLGNLDARYKGAEMELSFKATRLWDLYANFGYTNSRITSMADPTVIGNQAPLVSRTTLNVGTQLRQPINAELTGVGRLDFEQIGRTWWDPYNSTSRNPVNLVNLRLGVDAERWSLTAWSKNLTNTTYNAEFSPGGFLWKALPRRYGIDLSYRF